MKPFIVPLVLLSCLLFAASSRREAAVKAVPPPASGADVSTASPRAPTSAQEPPEEVLRDLMFRQYKALNMEGGMPVVVTASGRSGILRSKLYSVSKNRCVHGPPRPPGVFECSLDLMVTMWWDGQREPRVPGKDAKRIDVVQDANGVWIDCALVRRHDRICSHGNGR